MSSGADSYTSLFPTLYADKYDGEYENSENTVYLTFDDGPSVLTENLLYYLRQENVKATFFVVPERTEYCYSLLREISNAGHTIGIHSASHDYEKIYASVDAFLEDFNEAYEIVLEATGKAPDIYRFPGGSVNDYNEKTRTILSPRWIAEVLHISTGTWTAMTGRVTAGQHCTQTF